MAQSSIATILRSFRLKELQHILGELGLTKAGRKADQQQRLQQYIDSLVQSSTGQREAAGTADGSRSVCTQPLRMQLTTCSRREPDSADPHSDERRASSQRAQHQQDRGP